MIGYGAISTIAVIVGFGAFVGVVGLWLLNYRRTEDATRATDRTSRKVIGVISAAVFAIVIAFSNLAGLFGVLGDIVSTWPGAVGQFVLATLAVAGFAGYVEMGVVAGTILVLAIIAGTAAVRN
ncbi:hypothetical protein [Halobellus captivus]|uniref:hypothetical protein n=1 Tax=Halobellus captivus TaxID=2592614 RepID=UPI00119DD8F1|nr:hypothetical protein [Halobellus captivus]